MACQNTKADFVRKFSILVVRSPHVNPVLLLDFGARACDEPDGGRPSSMSLLRGRLLLSHAFSCTVDDVPKPCYTLGTTGKCDGDELVRRM